MTGGPAPKAGAYRVTYPPWNFFILQISAPERLTTAISPLTLTLGTHLATGSLRASESVLSGNHCVKFCVRKTGWVFLLESVLCWRCGFTGCPCFTGG